MHIKIHTKLTLKRDCFGLITILKCDRHHWIIYQMHLGTTRIRRIGKVCFSPVSVNGMGVPQSLGPGPLQGETPVSSPRSFLGGGGLPTLWSEVLSYPWRAPRGYIPPPPHRTDQEGCSARVVCLLPSLRTFLFLWFYLAKKSGLDNLIWILVHLEDAQASNTRRPMSFKNQIADSFHPFSVCIMDYFYN